MNLKELYDTDITVRINNEDWKLKIEAAAHPREHAVLIQLINPSNEPKHFTLMDKEIFKERDKDTVMKDIIEPVINKLKARVPLKELLERASVEHKAVLEYLKDK